ncbi:hypothetical protein KPH14_009786 [Odynerus spinipes]|uniref:Uncharacterized protein n=1 Tax=Odynerus spinipes TaxID=1348599 RepID=A0AAD9VTV7_9HYME|nr:hypothetical protein KPH14_009786 [Odynerus spinipes]
MEDRHARAYELRRIEYSQQRLAKVPNALSAFVSFSASTGVGVARGGAKGWGGKYPSNIKPLPVTSWVQRCEGFGAYVTNSSRLADETERYSVWDRECAVNG